ncbi:MAG: hypothetical protein WA461_12135 [Nitrososphaeraceae archaeon]
MDSKQIFMIVVIVAALSTVMIATPVMAQNTTGENMTGKVSGFGPELLSDNTAPRSECPVDAEGFERCGPQGPPGTDSNGDTNGNGNDDASGDGNGEDSSNGNGNGDNQ